ncbi:hypothetical protein [Paraliomyxa miuraensis]|uniref:hypothetical protein n=1 Tax=Paraliomyxa miuraensis TaxID=376150 RepID=UPI0022526D82|nr:hypothetical protein [Paraliomyxa miuraensis]MCX4239641.1 hypothetical protein [Paraliomyxa miuraensis]
MLLAAFSAPTVSRKPFWETFADPGGHLFGKRIHDPFLGGGSTVVEAARLGAMASGTDIDPLACLIARHELSPPDVETLSKYGKRLADYLCSRLETLYHSPKSEWTPLHWFWIYIVACPSCKAKAPLYRSLVIARDMRKTGAVVRDSAQTVFCPDCFDVHHLASPTAKRFTCCGHHDIRESTFSNLKFHCPSCEKHADHSQLKTLKAEPRLLAVEETHATKRRRIRAAHRGDRARVRSAQAFVDTNRADLLLPEGTFTKPRRDPRPLSYGAESHLDLFYTRQLATFGLAFSWIRDCRANDHVKEALMLATSHALAFNNRLCGYATDYGRLSALFSVRSYSLPALSAELNPLHPTAGRGTLLRILRKRLTETRTVVRRAAWGMKAQQVYTQEFQFADTLRSEIRCASALSPNVSPDPIDFSFFDPPYFDYIAYSELSEFYRAWLDLGDIEGTPLLPDTSDPVASFATALAAAIAALRSKLKPCAPFAFTFHSGSNNAWRAIAEALASAGECITAMWPVLADPHMGHHGAAGACEWDLVIVCRPDGLCRPGRSPSISRWRRAVQPLTIRKTDLEAFKVALGALRGLFGTIPTARNTSASRRRHEG